ncbi:hypothetical protein SPI_09362 [Niveomyces insectorum RCEF 264]|uniref:Uncharacterized protein n=1 Tax=Niveomyces insectorum RCEF 264 TaxID=1081102 RepID=A0A162I8B4_9HYPO|nr:hypothetical protein SPI_09362 [Niveomyces insectorum RCEF 264]
MAFKATDKALSASAVVEIQTSPQQQDNRLAAAKMPASFTAFTSRQNLPPSESKTHDDGGPSHDARATVAKSTGSSSCTYISSSAISFYSEDDSEWEDDNDAPAKPGGRAPAKPIVFERIDVVRPTVRTSNLTLMINRARSEEETAVAGPSRGTGGGGGGGSSTASSSNNTTQSTLTSGPPHRRPNPLAYRPAYPTLTPPPALPPTPPATPPSPFQSSSSTFMPVTALSPPPPPPPSPAEPTVALAPAAAPPPLAPLMRIPQLASPHAFHACAPPRSLADRLGGSPLLVYPFNGASGPRADPVVQLGPPLASTGGITSPRTIRPSRALLPSEMSRSLQECIAMENHSRYVFPHYGSRRRVEADAPANNSSPDDMQFRRTQSAPDIHQVAPDRAPSFTHPAMPTASSQDAVLPTASFLPIPGERRTGRAVLREGNGKDAVPPPARFDYVDDYVPPQSWSSGTSYHATGW